MSVSEDPAEIVRLWLAASNAGNVEGMLDLYDDDAVHESPKVKAAVPNSDGKLVGKAAIRSWWRESVGASAALNYELTSLTSNDVRAVIEYVRRIPGQDPLSVAESFEVRNGKIVHSIVYHF